jgi:hypothetical protein
MRFNQLQWPQLADSSTRKVSCICQTLQHVLSVVFQRLWQGAAVAQLTSGLQGSFHHSQQSMPALQLGW